MPSDLGDRLAIVDQVLADPPAVHPMDYSADPDIGVWSTEPSCYRFLAEHCPEGTRTLETGSGLSTVLFAALGAEHICCTPSQDEADRIVAHCTSRRLPTRRLQFEVALSQHSLPAIERSGEVRDLVLIDGGHGFPVPMVDWFYGASTLRSGGILVLDDVNLPAVRALRRFVDQDPRWEALAGTDKWRAWRRLHEGSLSEDWTEQVFYRSRRDRIRQLRQGAQVRVQRLVRYRQGRNRTP